MSQEDKKTEKQKQVTVNISPNTQEVVKKVQAEFAKKTGVKLSKAQAIDFALSKGEKKE